MVDIFEVLLLVGAVFAIIALLLPGAPEARRPRWQMVGQIRGHETRRRRARPLVHVRPMAASVSRPMPVRPAPVEAPPADASDRGSLGTDPVIKPRLSPARR